MPLEYSEKLQFIDISNTKIRSITPLLGLNKLQVINAVDSNIVYIEQGLLGFQLEIQFENFDPTVALEEQPGIYLGDNPTVWSAKKAKEIVAKGSINGA